MEKSFNLDIISLSRTTFSGQVHSLSVPGSEGELTILPHHIPLIAPLKAGEVTVRGDREPLHLAISSGFLLVEENKVTLLVDTAERLEELQEEKIEAARQAAEKAIRQRSFADDRAFADTAAALEKSLAHLRLLRKHRNRHKGSAPSAD